jgi:hypothetical protein
MTRLVALGVPVDVITYRMGVASQLGMVPLSWFGDTLAKADREAVLLLGRELDQAVAALATAGLGYGQDG